MYCDLYDSVFETDRTQLVMRAQFFLFPRKQPSSKLTIAVASQEGTCCLELS